MDELEKAADDDLLVVPRQKPIHELLGELIQRENEQRDQKNAAVGGVVHREANAAGTRVGRTAVFVVKAVSI
jgi:hypothetical protein